MGAAVGSDVGEAVGARVGAVVVALVVAGVGATVELPEAGGEGAMVGATLCVRGGGERREAGVSFSSSVDESCVDFWIEKMCVDREGEVCGCGRQSGWRALFGERGKE